VAPEIWKELEKFWTLESVVETISKLYWPLLTLVGMVKVAVPVDAGTVATEGVSNVCGVHWPTYSM